MQLLYGTLSYRLNLREYEDMTTILHPGQRVTIEGQDYTVQPRPGNEGLSARNSDPIAFRPAE